MLGVEYLEYRCVGANVQHSGYTHSLSKGGFIAHMSQYVVPGAYDFDIPLGIIKLQVISGRVTDAGLARHANERRCILYVERWRY